MICCFSLLLSSDCRACLIHVQYGGLLNIIFNAAKTVIMSVHVGQNLVQEAVIFTDSHACNQSLGNSIDVVANILVCR
jgi:hypothetical protein